MNLRKQWNSMARTYNWSQFELEVVLPRFLGIIGDLKGKKVLDLGCGPGCIAALLAKSGGDVTGIDRSNGMLEVAREQEKRLKQGIEYIHHDISEINNVLTNSEYDSAVFSFVFHNIYPIKKMYKTLEAASNNLKKGGSVFILDPHPCFDVHRSKDNTRIALNPAVYKKNFPIKIILRHKDGKTTTIHHRHRPLQDYINALALAGFKIELIEEVTAPERLSERFKPQYQNPFYMIIKATKL